MPDPAERMTPQSHAMFNALLHAYCEVSTPWSKDADPSRAQAQAGFEKAILDAIPTLESSYADIGDILRTPSLPVQRAALEAPHLLRLREVFDQLCEESQNSDRLDTITEFTKCSGALIDYLWRKGLPLHRAPQSIAWRYLLEPSADLDAIARATFPGHAHPLLGALQHFATPLSQLCTRMPHRHLRTLELVARGEIEDIEEILPDLVDNAFIFRDWVSLALLMRLGLDLSHLANQIVLPVRHLLILTGSRHGQIKLFELEPDIDALADRPGLEPRFGISPSVLKSALKPQ